MRNAENRKAVSPVISTIILVTLTITVSVVNTYWIRGIAGQYTTIEKIEFQSGVCQIQDAKGSEQGQKKGVGGSEYWNVTLTLKNTGTASASMINVYVNDIEVTQYNSSAAVDGEAVTSMSDPMTILSGAFGYIHIYVDYDNYLTLSSGTIISIRICSASGMDYIKLIELV